MRISDKQLQILQHLARYTYLTTPHLVALGISTRPNHISGRHLKPLIEGRFPLVEFNDYTAIEKGRRIRKPRIHTLSKRGRDTLADYLQVSPETIYYPLNKIQFTRDYAHRTRTIDLLISFDLFAQRKGAETPHFDPYYRYSGSQRKKGSQLTSLASVPYSGGILVPDANLHYQTDEENKLYALELERQPKAKRIIEEKIFPHAQIIAEGHLSQKYDYPFSHRVLFAFENLTTMQSVASSLDRSQDFDPDLKECFLFALFDEVREDFSAWKSAKDSLL